MSQEGLRMEIHHNRGDSAQLQGPDVNHLAPVRYSGMIAPYDSQSVVGPA